jgi:two-component system cell cycle sensor histidine kinase PleC
VTSRCWIVSDSKHGNGTFTLKSKVRIGTELIATFPPERVMAALPPLSEPSPPIQPQQEADSSSPKSKRSLFQFGN